MARERAVEGWRELFEAAQQAEPPPVRPTVSTAAQMPPPPGHPGSSRWSVPSPWSASSLTRVRSARADRPDGTWTRQMISFLPGHTKEASAIPEAFQRNTQYSIQECLQAADETHGMGYPVVALILVDYVLRVAQRLDPESKKRGVLQFKTILHNLVRSEGGRERRGDRAEDIQEIDKFYVDYKAHIDELEEKNEQVGLAAAWTTTKVLKEVLDSFSVEMKDSAPSHVTKEFEVLKRDISMVAQNTKKLSEEQFNIVPINVEAQATHPTLAIPEVRFAIRYLKQADSKTTPMRYGLPTDPRTKKPFIDVFDFLQHVFGFQEGSVNNQREHLVLLLANRLASCLRSGDQQFINVMPDVAKGLHASLLGNYVTWTEYVGFTIPFGKAGGRSTGSSTGSSHSCDMIYVALFLLVWGEAANVRFMPECLCYIFHIMAEKLAEQLGEWPEVSIASPGPRKEDESFLDKVVTPIYQVIHQEAEYAGEGLGARGHQNWRNYDDLNEYFWSKQCKDLTPSARHWPYDLCAGFFTAPPKSGEYTDQEQIPLKAPDEEAPRVLRPKKRLTKTLFTEWRSFFHLYHAFDRLWIFLIVAFQAEVMVAFSGPGNAVTAKKVATVFPTIAILQFLQAVLDVVLSLGAYASMTAATGARKLMRLMYAGVWAGALTFFCIKMLQENDSLGNHTFLSLFIILCIAFVAPRLLTTFILRCAQLRQRTDVVSTWKIVRFVKWFYQEDIYVGRGLYESTTSFMLYSTFWFLLLVSKLLFTYYYQVQPLVGPTSYIIKYVNINYKWHDLVSAGNHNALTILALWAPVFIIYLLDLQIWYTILSAILGGLTGVWWHLGEIRTLGKMRSRFLAIPDQFVVRLQSSTMFQRERSNQQHSGSLTHQAAPAVPAVVQLKNAQRFALAWNEIILCLRDEDYICNDEVKKLLMPDTKQSLYVEMNQDALVHWPVFLLANQVHMAIELAQTARTKSSLGNTLWDGHVWQQVCKDEFMRCAVVEVLKTIEPLFEDVLRGPQNEQYLLVVKTVFTEIENAKMKNSVGLTFDLRALPTMHTHLSNLTAILLKEESKENHDAAVKAMLGLYDAVWRDFTFLDFKMPTGGGSEDSFDTLCWPTDLTRVRRLHLLLTTKGSAKEVPRNEEARRRLQFFTNSLFMNMPETPTVKRMLPFSVITPYYSEIVAYSLEELLSKNEDQISTLFYLKKIFPDEWTNFLERVGWRERDLDKMVRIAEQQGAEQAENTHDPTALRMWASFRGQTLARTVRGMMYYQRALQLLGHIENHTWKDEEYARESFQTDQSRAWADIKFTYVVTCQIYGQQKKQQSQRAADILDLMTTHKGLRVAYIDEVEGRFYSCLLKVDAVNQEKEVYRIRLPGPAKVGEGKPENQNHAIIFTRGEALQTIDMNQDHYLEEALKMRNLLAEFTHFKGLRRPTILGVREHIFTGSVSSLANFMSNQESSFVTLGQRFLAYPLKVRMHYGHPDVFDRLWFITRGGISKASKTINISEDIFAGFNTTLRKGHVSHHEYIQVGKGRDVGLNQIALFEGKVASGNGEQVLSRDVYRLGQQFDFFRMLSFYYTSVGFYVSTMLTVLCVYAFLYGRVYMVLSGVEASLMARADVLDNLSLSAALNTQFLLQIGIFTAVPMIVEFVVEQGVTQAFFNFVTMQLQGAVVFFTFSLGTRTHYFGRTLLHGGAKYKSTGRGFVVRHEKFDEIYRLFSRSHFVKGFEVALCLIILAAYGVNRSSSTYILLTLSSWFLALSWLFSPFIFNPSGFEWVKTVEDFTTWSQWMLYEGGVGMSSKISWEQWWEDEVAHIRSFPSVVAEIVLSLRFFVFQYGVAYALHVTKGNSSIGVYGVSWLILAVLVLLLWLFNIGSTWNAQLLIRLTQGFVVAGGVVVLIMLCIYRVLTVGDIFASVFAFIPTGWAILSILVSLRKVVKKWGKLWEAVRNLARFYDLLMGFLIFLPLTFLSWFPFVQVFQTRLMFNQAFTRGLQVSVLLSGKDE